MSSTDPTGSTGDPTPATPAADARPSQHVDRSATVRDEGRQARTDRRLVFRHSRLTIAVLLVAAVGALPLILSVPYFFLVLLVPIALIGWVLRIRTVVDTETVTARSLTRSRSVRWDQVSALRLGKKSGVSAVLTDDTELPLPAVHVRDLPALAAASGGRITDPAGDQT